MTRLARGSVFISASLLLLLLVLALVLGPPRAIAVPATLAGLPRTHVIEGAEARAAINRLHGKSITARDAFVAHYERDGGIAMLYVTRAWLAPIAGWQFARMVQGIESKGANREGRFTYVRSREQAGVLLYSALGLGQVHYFYRSGPLIVWVAADAPVARAALEDTLPSLR